MPNETATFAAGCFWGVEQSFRDTKGVVDTEVGYIGGHSDNPTYEAICRKGTGHAEAVRVSFDPAIVSYDELLALFWTIHNPTQKNRQGPDVGDQYRSALFPRDATQKNAAVAALESEDKSGRHAAPIATQIEPDAKWWKAEDYHQQYFEKNGGACNIN